MPASGCARMSPRSCVITCDWASSCTSPSRSRGAAVFGYLRACAPVEVDVTLLSVADRLATRGDRAQESIDAHLALAREMLGDALSWRERGAPAPLLRGDELVRELGIPAGPLVGGLLEGLAEAQYAGEVRTRDDALSYAERLIDSAG